MMLILCVWYHALLCHLLSLDMLCVNATFLVSNYHICELCNAILLQDCRRSRKGGPQTCLAAARGVAQKGAQHGPSSSTQTQDPREGPSLGGRTTRSFLRHGLSRLAREEAERSRRGTSRGARDASHDDQGRQAGASPRSVLLSSLVQREQAQARASSKDTRFGATRPRPVQRQGGSHCGAQASITTGAFCRRGPTLVRISVPGVPLQNGQLLAPFPLNIWEEA